MSYSEQDLTEVIDELWKRKEREKILNKLELSEVLSVCQLVGTKEGNSSFRKYTRKLHNDLQKLDDELTRKEDFWSGLRKKEKQSTLFDALKRAKRDGV